MLNIIQDNPCMFGIILLLLMMMVTMSKEGFVPYDYSKNPEQDQSGRIKWKYMYDWIHY